MGKIIAIANNKGGVGKTTTAVNVAAALRLRGYDVLLIDCDGQCNLTETLRIATDGGTLYDAMGNSNRKIDPVRLLSPGNGAGVLDALPASPDLSAMDLELSKAPDRLTRFARIAGTYRDGYDVIMIDTPPTLGLLSVSALYASDAAILTLQPHYLAVRGLVALSDTIKTIETNRGRALPFTILFTQADNRKSLHRLVIEQVNASGYNVAGTTIRDNIALAEAPATGTDIFRYKPNSNGAKDYATFCGEYLRANKDIRHTKHGYK